MKRLRPPSALAGLAMLAGCLPAPRAAEPAPVPALKYRLYPQEADRRDGNAVPIYLRLAHERTAARAKELREKPEAWNRLPLDKLPLSEVKRFLTDYEYNFRQLELGARR